MEAAQMMDLLLFTEDNWITFDLSLQPDTCETPYTLANSTQPNEISYKLAIKNEGELNLYTVNSTFPSLNVLSFTSFPLYSIEDLGNNFNNLLELRINKANLVDLSGLICFSQLHAIDFADNKIDDLIEISFLSTLKYINLTNNKITDLENIEFLSSNEQLVWLSLVGNPVTTNELYAATVKNKLKVSWLDESKEDESENNVVEKGFKLQLDTKEKRIVLGMHSSKGNALVHN